MDDSLQPDDFWTWRLAEIRAAHHRIMLETGEIEAEDEDERELELEA